MRINAKQLLTVAVSCLALTGCGSSGGGSGTTQPGGSGGSGNGGTPTQP